MIISTSANGVIYWVDKLCPRSAAPDLACSIREMEHFGQPGTGFLWCHSHGELVGTVTSQGGK